MAIPEEPITRKEQYLARAAGQESVMPDKPVTREEMYLDEIAKNSGGTDVEANPEESASESLKKVRIDDTVYSIPQGGGGGGGTSDYVDLENKPQINGNTLAGNKTAADLGLVGAEQGKGLSTNDYTTTEKTKLEGLSNYDDTEVRALIASKADAEDVPTKTSDLVNDSGFIQNTVNNLVNYYLKSQIYTKTEVEDIVSAISTLSLEPVEQLPTTDISTTKIYLVPTSTENVMEQYINRNGTQAGWVKIGDTRIDLSGYVTISALNIRLADYVTQAELSTYVVDANYVHTDNNYTNTDKAIVDGVTSALALKADKSEIPENTSDLTNDSGFITNTVNNLANYYLKTQTYTQTEVDALIAAVKNGRFISVATLPTTDIDTKAIYLVPSADPQATNVKDEYINLDGTSAGWELIGSTAIDLSGYVTDTDLTTALADYTTTANLTTLLAAKQDTISDLATIRSGASAGATAYQKPAAGIPKTDLASAVQTSLEKADSAVQNVSGKADKVTNATNGNFAGLDATGNLTDSGKKASDFMPSDGVIANPTGTATGDLTSIGIGGTKYDIPSGGSSTLADLSDVNISSPSDGQILQYDGASSKWVNHINTPEFIVKTITIYSAGNDTVSFSDISGEKTVVTDSSGEGTVKIVCVDGLEITFTSSVAKNPSDLSQAYSKTVTIGVNTTEVYVMPNNVLYWYGYKSSNLQDMADGGWNSAVRATYNTNKIVLASSSSGGSVTSCGVSVNNAVSGYTKLYAIYKGITASNNTYGALRSETSKAFSFDGQGQADLINNTVSLAEATSSRSYPCVYTMSVRSSEIYAFWYE